MVCFSNATSLYIISGLNNFQTLSAIKGRCHTMNSFKVDFNNFIPENIAITLHNSLYPIYYPHNHKKFLNLNALDTLSWLILKQYTNRLWYIIIFVCFSIYIYVYQQHTFVSLMPLPRVEGRGSTIVCLEMHTHTRVWIILIPK